MDSIYKIGDIITGTISGLQHYGAFVEFENGQQGLIHISEITPTFVKNIEDFLEVGQSIRVKVIAAEEKNNFLRLSIKQMSERERQVIRRPLMIRKPQRIKVPSNEKDFAALKAKIPMWIEQALKEENSDD